MHRFLLQVMLLIVVGLPIHGLCEGCDNPSLSLQIAPVKSTLLVGEPILIECLFTNISDEPIGILPWLSGLHDFFDFTVRKPDGSTYRFTAGLFGTLLPGADFERVVLSPGESCRHTVGPLLGYLVNLETGTRDKIVPGRNLDFVPRDPGIYEITVTFRNGLEFTSVRVWQGSVTSNTISVEIKRPTCEADAAALEIWESNDSRAYFYGVFNIGSAGIDTWRKLINDYPESVYALYASYYLGEGYMFVNPPRYEDAIAQFQVALDLLPENHPLRALAEHYIGVCLLATGKTGEGVQVLEASLPEKGEPTSVWTVGARDLISSPDRAQSDRFNRRHPLKYAVDLPYKR